MSKWEVVRHQVAIAGRVVDACSGRAFAGAQVTLSHEGGPDQAAFAQAQTALDGLFHFLDLPDGDYSLEASLPAAGSRYGTGTTNDPVTVPPISKDHERQIKFAFVDIALPPTRIHGLVTRGDNEKPIAGARVRLCGDAQIALTDAEGQYALTGLVQGNPTIEVKASNFMSSFEKRRLEPGTNLRVDVQLTTS